MSTRVVHINDRIPGAIYIGRANKRYGVEESPFANAYKIGRDGDRAGCIAYYRDDLLKFRGANSLLPLLPDLRGKPLACWCRHDGAIPTPGTACHGDVLVELLEQYTDDELRNFGR